MPGTLNTVAASDPLQFPAALAEVLPGEPDRHQAASPTVTARDLVSSSAARGPEQRPDTLGKTAVRPVERVADPRLRAEAGRPTACTPHAKESGPANPVRDGRDRPGSS